MCCRSLSMYARAHVICSHQYTCIYCPCPHPLHTHTATPPPKHTVGFATAAVWAACHTSGSALSPTSKKAHAPRAFLIFGYMYGMCMCMCAAAPPHTHTHTRTQTRVVFCFVFRRARGLAPPLRRGASCRARARASARRRSQPACSAR